MFASITQDGSRIPVSARPMRSKLFVPGTRPDRFARALATGADAISIDLEDSVLASRKEEGRNAVAHFLQAEAGALSGVTIVVRINGLATPHFEADVNAIVRHGLHLVNLPKAESARDIRLLADALSEVERSRGIAEPIGILANIESPAGLRRAAEIAAADERVVGLQLGLGDLFEPLGIDASNAAAIHQVQLAVRLAAGEAGVAAYDAAFANVDDPPGFRMQAQRARQLGFSGKTCIHPSQVGIANEVFRPREAEIAVALRTIAAWRETRDRGGGAFLVDGLMIDAPGVARAEAVIARARQLGLLSAQNCG